MIFSYRTRRFLARIVPSLCIVLVLILVGVICWLLWLQRFVVYTPQGAVFDFGLQPPAGAGIHPQRPSVDRVTIEYADDTPGVTPPPDIGPDVPVIPDDPVKPEQTAISGYYIEAKQVWDDPDGLRQQLERLPAGTTVMLQLANFWGYRYYTSEFETQISEVNRKKMDDLLAWMTDRELYVVGRMPAFRDYFYVEKHSNLGLKRENGYTWEDADGSYWLNPKSETVLTRLTQMVRELRNLGFDEVVFDDFYFPESEQIAFTGDRKQTIYQAAETLVVACATEDFAVSFVTADYGFRLPEGNCRLYINNVESSAVETILSQIQVADKTTRVVFFCSTFDNRFDGCSVIRPIALAP